MRFIIFIKIKRGVRCHRSAVEYLGFPPGTDIFSIFDTLQCIVSIGDMRIIEGIQIQRWVIPHHPGRINNIILPVRTIVITVEKVRILHIKVGNMRIADGIKIKRSVVSHTHRPRDRMYDLCAPRAATVRSIFKIHFPEILI